MKFIGLMNSKSPSVVLIPAPSVSPFYRTSNVGDTNFDSSREECSKKSLEQIPSLKRKEAYVSFEN